MNNKHTLKSVAQKTGLSAHVIRSWEKRYLVVSPKRTKTNRRYYSDEEVQKLIILKNITDSGRAIGSISSLSIEQLEKLFLEDDKADIFQHKKLLPEKFELIIQNLINEFFKTAEDYNSKKMKFLIYEIEDEFSQSVIIEEIILPILNKLDEKRKNNSISKINEQFILNELSNYLLQIINKIPEFDEFPLLLTYSPIGGFFQIGSLISAAIAKCEKWRVCNLGENLTSAEISGAINKLSPSAVSINMVYPFLQPEEIKNELYNLKTQIPGNVKIILSGRAVWNYREEVIKIGGIFAGNTFVLRKELQKIKDEIIVL